MSIPPLVCSTPPPPDQCEEDKDHEDFDLSYNLSQDDDDNDYNFGNFSSYSNIQSDNFKGDGVPAVNDKILTSCEFKIPSQIETIENNSKDINHSESYTTTPSKLKCDDDINIEDLELEISDESIETSIKEENEELNGSSLESSISESNIVNEVTENHLTILSHSPAIEDNSVESLSIEGNKPISSEVGVEAPDIDVDISTEPCTISNDETKQVLHSETLTGPKEETTNVDDDFGDFDDLQFASTEKKPIPLIDTYSNPWHTNESDGDDFGNFTANFEAVEEVNIISDLVSEAIQKDGQSYEVQDVDDNGEDDFGDFDDFKSSAVDTKYVAEYSLSSQGPGINFHLSDNESQIMESISNVLNSIFEEEVVDPVVEFEGKLETMLSETWRHLKETDVRQPYIINWNNSLGQKTLLKALCIDSRNILFGPKWSYNMPKYAVNLNNAPLQPQKPLAALGSSPSETVSSDKTANKPGGWVDPFTSDGQEFTYAEALLLDLEHLMATLDQMAQNNSTFKISEILSHACNTERESVVEVTSSDLDVFGAAISTKSEEIYPSTLNVQPLRQINLPDTHIFTPTDSETPRSKTIHNDSGPPILLPQPVLETTKPVESFLTQTTETSSETNNNDDDDDDWEFQDFKCSTTTASIATAPQPKENPLELKAEINSKPDTIFQSQVLQPIRMEPLMPSLNWPDPGEVKETFEDFSEFASKTSWNNEPSHRSSQDSKAMVESDTLDNNSKQLATIEKKESNVRPLPPVSKSDSFDDDFDTFQSALPPKCSLGDFANDGLNSPSFNDIPNQSTSPSPSMIKDFDYTFPKSNKSDTISVENTTKPNEALTQSLGFIPSPELTTNKNSLLLVNPMSSNLLKPLPINSNITQKHQKTAQILQPLSLESYSQINWPNPGIDLQDLSRFNPVESLQSLKTEGGPSKGASPVHVQKNPVTNQVPEDDIWGEFVSSKPKPALPKKAPDFVDDDEWTDFVSSPSVKPQNGLNTISLNVHTNSNIQKTSNINKFATKKNKVPLDIPTLNYITPKSSGHNSYNDRQFQNL